VYWNVINDASRRAQCAIHAYVLMSNHVHLLVAPAQAGGVASMIQIVGRQYVQYFNRRHDRTGTLWEGRYRSALIDSDQYLFACMRYIELNPVRAGIARHPRDYAWSSYLANAELEPDPLVTPHPLYHRLAGNAAGRAATYREIVHGAGACPAVDMQVREATHGGHILGSPAFRRRVVGDLGLPSEPKRHGGSRR
jgi:putative transposase